MCDGGDLCTTQLAESLRPSTTTIVKEIILKSLPCRSHKARDMISWLWFSLLLVGSVMFPRPLQADTL